MAGPRSRRAFVAMLITLGLALLGLVLRFGGPAQAQYDASDAGVDDATSADDAAPDTEAGSTEAGSTEAGSTDPPAARGSNEGPQEVIVGAYLRNVENIDLASNSYSLSMVLWMKWRPGGIDPTRSFRLTNVIDESSLTVSPVYPEPLEVDGYLYQRFRIEGTFWHKFWLGTFPLDWQRVTLELEDPVHVTDELVYVPDVEASGVHHLLRIPGWTIVEETNESFDAELDTDLGMGELSPGNTFPGYRFGLRIERPIAFYTFKILPPILITLATCFLVFLLKPMYVDARVGTPIAALLTAVFLQLTFTGGLPNVGIMLLLDHVFNLSYTVIFAIALVCMVTTRLTDRVAVLEVAIGGVEDDDERAEKREHIERLSRVMKRLDRTMLVVLPIVYLIGVGIITITVRGPYVFEMLGR